MLFIVLHSLMPNLFSNSTPAPDYGDGEEDGHQNIEEPGMYLYHLLSLLGYNCLRVGKGAGCVVIHFCV